MELLVHLLVSNYTDHIPLYRLEQIAARVGVDLPRQKLSRWVEHTALLLRSIHDRLRARILASDYVQIDETQVKVLNPDCSGHAAQAYLWTYLSSLSEAIVFDFDLSRSRGNLCEFFPPDWREVLQSEGYEAYGSFLRDKPRIVHAVRAELRQRESVPILERLHEQFNLIAQSELPQSRPGKAAAYVLARWGTLTRYAESGMGHVLIDQNSFERSICPTKLGAKNWLYIGHPDAGWRSAVTYSITGTCKLLKVNPTDYLT